MDIESIPGPPPSTLITRFSQSKIVWVGALAVSSLISILAVLRGGYVGPDYWLHLDKMVSWDQVFDFAWIHPPTYYLFGHGLYLLIGRNNGFPFTLSIIQVLINAVALFYFFRYTEGRFRSPIIRFAFVLFLTFLPVRMIHAASLGTDWTTIPVFVLILFLVERLLSEHDLDLRHAALIGAGLALGVWSKYSFVALLPALMVIYISLWIRRRWSLGQFVMVCLLSFAVPTSLMIYTYWAGKQTQSLFTDQLWLPKAGVPEMDFKDLLTVKAADIELFKAPEMFATTPADAGRPYPVSFRVPHKHSYLGMSHMSVFTDPMNLFQIMPIPHSMGIRMIPDVKVRSPWKTNVMQASVTLGVIWTLMALIGTPWLLFRAFKNLYLGTVGREDVIALLGTAFFLPLFLSIPFVNWGALNGFWLPRLILVPLLFFFLAGFLLMDKLIRKRIGVVVLGLVVVQGAIEIVMLI